MTKSGLQGCWTDSNEENSQGSKVSIFRPCDYMVFPPSRFRFTMNLKSDSKCSWLVLAPNDGHYMQEGTWTYNEKTDELKLYNLEGKEIRKFIIEEVGENILKLRK